jgi:hypothetical protein
MPHGEEGGGGVDCRGVGPGPFCQKTAKSTEVGKTDDIKSVDNIFRSPVSACKEVGRVDWCMKCEKVNILILMF